MDDFDILEDSVLVIFTQKLIGALSDAFFDLAKNMNLAEYKTLVYALTQIRRTDPDNSNVVLLDKKTLADIIGISADPNRLNQNLKRAIWNLPEHSGIEISIEDEDFWESGQLITNVCMLQDHVRITFDKEYIVLFREIIDPEFLTLWAEDIFSMRSIRSVILYEELMKRTNY